MREKKLAFTDYIFIGTLLFGMLFGAGNLIFPVHLGQLAGKHVNLASLGFMITGVGLPFLAIIALALSKSQGVYDLAQNVGDKFAWIFTAVLYLTIGPIFALPRTATVSFEVGILPNIDPAQRSWILAVFSGIFFLLVWYFSRKPSGVMVVIGKILTPLFLMVLGLLLAMALIFPLGKVAEIAPQASYRSGAFLQGFTQGYNTMDVLACLAFGVVINDAVRNLGVKKETQIALDTIKGGIFTIALMIIIYGLLALVGAMSLGRFTFSENGGITLAQISQAYFGKLGSWVLAILVTLACLKTAIGLVSSCSETFMQLFKRGSYPQYVAGISLVSWLIANVGLTQLIALSQPLLLLLYPLAITMTILGCCHRFLVSRFEVKVVYRWACTAAVIFSLGDIAAALPFGLASLTFSKSLVALSQGFLPLASLSLGWLIPTIVATIIALFLAHKKANN